MTDQWADIDACTPIRVNANGDGPVADSDVTPDCETVCWTCGTPWPCDAFRAGRPERGADGGGPEPTARKR